MTQTLIAAVLCTHTVHAAVTPLLAVFDHHHAREKISSESRAVQQ